MTYNENLQHSLENILDMDRSMISLKSTDFDVLALFFEDEEAIIHELKQFHLNLESKLTELLRIEIKSHQLRKLPIGFYDSFRKVIVSLNEESSDALENKELISYLGLKKQKARLESSFKVFFQSRWEKIAVIAQYDLIQDDLTFLSNHEKEAALELEALYRKFFNQFIGGEQ